MLIKKKSAQNQAPLAPNLAQNWVSHREFIKYFVLGFSVCQSITLFPSISLFHFFHPLLISTIRHGNIRRTVWIRIQHCARENSERKGEIRGEEEKQNARNGNHIMFDWRFEEYRPCYFKEHQLQPLQFLSYYYMKHFFMFLCCCYVICILRYDRDRTFMTCT